MVLAGGKGKRLEVLCHTGAKPALPFGRVFRVIDFSLSNCIHSGIDRVAMLVDYRSHEMAEYLGRSCFADSGPPIDILAPGLASYQGTADAVSRNPDYVARHGADAVLILAGDHVYKMDCRKMLMFHSRSGADVTVAVTRVPLADVRRFGRVEVDSRGG